MGFLIHRKKLLKPKEKQNMEDILKKLQEGMQAW
jgi:hypothetical protein